MRQIIAAGTSHVGQVREGNEDAYLVADSVVAVADGMGGHLAGEVASSTALEPLRELDGRVFPDAPEALTALRDAVVAANDVVARMATDEPSYRGMGTTLTAALLEGRRLHVAHVGDSRAYLLRNGDFSQLTTDHTFVQHLIDEGQLTHEEAASHPQRSVITRAIGVSPEVEVDAMTLDLEPGDVILLCSDGLTGVVPDSGIADVLGEMTSLETALDRLVEMANDAGGPDNITAVILRFEDPDTGATATATATATGDGFPNTVSIRTRDDRENDNWAGKLGAYGSFQSSTPYTAPQGSDTTDAARFAPLVLRSVAVLVGVALLAGGLYAGGRFLLARSYFVGLDGQQVAIYQGIDADIGPVSLSWVTERSELTLEEVPSYYHPTLEEGLTAADINDARRLVRGVPTRDEREATDDGTDGNTDGTDDPSDDSGAGADASTSATDTAPSTSATGDASL